MDWNTIYGKLQQIRYCDKSETDRNLKKTIKRLHEKICLLNRLKKVEKQLENIETLIRNEDDNQLPVESKSSTTSLEELSQNSKIRCFRSIKCNDIYIVKQLGNIYDYLLTEDDSITSLVSLKPNFTDRKQKTAKKKVNQILNISSGDTASISDDLENNASTSTLQGTASAIFEESPETNIVPEIQNEIDHTGDRTKTNLEKNVKQENCLNNLTKEETEMIDKLYLVSNSTPTCSKLTSFGNKVHLSQNDLTKGEPLDNRKSIFTKTMRTYDNKRYSIRIKPSLNTIKEKPDDEVNHDSFVYHITKIVHDNDKRAMLSNNLKSSKSSYILKSLCECSSCSDVSEEEKNDKEILRNLPTLSKVQFALDKLNKVKSEAYRLDINFSAYEHVILSLERVMKMYNLTLEANQSSNCVEIKTHSNNRKMLYLSQKTTTNPPRIIDKIYKNMKNKKKSYSI